MANDKRKQSLYFPENMLAEIQKEALRLDRSLSWIVQKAWQLSRAEIARIPSVNDVGVSPGTGSAVVTFADGKSVALENTGT